MRNSQRNAVKPIFILSAWLLAPGFFALPAIAADIELSTNGRTNCQIVKPEKPSVVDDYAVAKLSDYLKLITGAEFPVVDADQATGGGRESHYFWWGNNLETGEGRLNISAIDFLPRRAKTWPLGKAPWSDGFPFVSPVDHYGAKGRNGFGLADMCGGVWEFVIDHFDPKGGHEEIHYEDAEKRTVSRPVCRGGNYFDVPGNARCAVRLGIASVTYSDSRDGFRICLGPSVPKQ